MSESSALDGEQLKVVKELAETTGRCDHCGQTVRLYKHRPNVQHVRVLRRLAEVVRESGENKINFDEIAGTFAQKSQRSKMRQHGLIARYKEDGHQVRNTWLITRKGFNFLAGVPIQETVVVYNNLVIGHEGNMVTVEQITDQPGDFQVEPMTPAEGRVYGEARHSRYGQQYEAKYKGHARSLERGEVYTVVVPKLALGMPITVQIKGTDVVMAYKDLAIFRANWEIIEEVKS